MGSSRRLAAAVPSCVRIAVGPELATVAGVATVPLIVRALGVERAFQFIATPAALAR
jgi:hypothetical protein